MFHKLLPNIIQRERERERDLRREVDVFLLGMDNRLAIIISPSDYSLL